MNPFNELTENDKELIRQYCISYANTEPHDLEKVLFYWNKNKRTLFKAFGNKLRVKIPIHCKMDKMYYTKILENLYSPLAWRNMQDVESWIPSLENNHSLMIAIGEYFKELILNGNSLSISDFHYLDSYFRYSSIEAGKTISSDYTFTNGIKTALKIPKGTKTLRAIRKVLEYYQFNRMDLFKIWKDELSLVNTDKNIDATLVFSIHPIDFMTLSDNNSGWSSCLSWVKKGSYSGGTIEMMNSNMAMVCYLESQRNFLFNTYSIPNKLWRTLVFANKDILLVGKHYPYQSKVLADQILDHGMKIFSSIGWTYQYTKQQYFDLIRYHNNDYIKQDLWRGNRWSSYHKIFVYTGVVMYNDMIEDTDTSYWCCRNWVPKSKFFNLSGPITCLCCGNKIYDSDECFPSSNSDKICDECHENLTCGGCAVTSQSFKENLISVPVMDTYSLREYRTTVCKDCLKNKYKWDCINKTFSLVDDLSSQKANRIAILDKRLNELQYQKIFDIIKEKDRSLFYHAWAFDDDLITKLSDIGIKVRFFYYPYAGSIPGVSRVYGDGYSWSFYYFTGEDTDNKQYKDLIRSEKRVLVPVTEDLIQQFKRADATLSRGGFDEFWRRF